MKRILLILALIVFSASYFSACSGDEIVSPTEEGGSTQESPHQWEDTD
jgi:hypothetical protein